MVRLLRCSAVVALTLVLAACMGGTQFVLRPLQVVSFPPVEGSAVRLYSQADSIPNEFVGVAIFESFDGMERLTDRELADRVRSEAARRGATRLYVSRTAKPPAIVAVFVSATPRTAEWRVPSNLVATLPVTSSLRRRPRLPTASSPDTVRDETSAPPASGGDRVQVRGYCRRDGVCVRPHTRSRPRRRN